MISPLAYVDPNAQLGQNVEVGPFAYIEKGVVIGDNCVIKAHANILEGTTMGTGNIVYQNAESVLLPKTSLRRRHSFKGRNWQQQSHSRKCSDCR